MVTQEQMILAINDVYGALKVGVLTHLHDGASAPEVARAPEDYYDALARTIVTEIRIRPDHEAAVTSLRSLLPLIEQLARCRTELIRSQQVAQGEPSERQKAEDELFAAIRRDGPLSWNGERDAPSYARGEEGYYRNVARLLIAFVQATPSEYREYLEGSLEDVIWFVENAAFFRAAIAEATNKGTHDPRWAKWRDELIKQIKNE